MMEEIFSAGFLVIEIAAFAGIAVVIADVRYISTFRKVALLL